MTMSTASAPELFRFDNTYARELTGCYASVTPATVPAPELLRLNDSLAAELGMNVAALDPALAAAVFAGNVVPAGATPIAQAYAGHQFGGFTSQLGVAAQTGQPFVDADLHRLDADLLLATGGEADEAAACYHRALAIARGQGARSFELRAATGLARLWRDQGKRAEARELLAPV